MLATLNIRLKTFILKTFTLKTFNLKTYVPWSSKDHLDGTKSRFVE